MRPAASVSACAALVLAACSTWAQDDDVPLPPRLDAAEAPRAAPARPPVRARLAPLPEDRPVQDEVVVVGDSGWRLPDLGSDWRAQQESERTAAARIRVTILPLYDPEAPRTSSDVFAVNRDAQRRHGVVELFRVRFGRRGRD